MSTSPPPPRPSLRLDIYANAILLTRQKGDGRITSYPIAARDLAAACAQVEQRSGLLPPDTLFWGQRGAQTALGIYVPARRWRTQTAARRYHLPLPPLVFAGRGTAYWVFAVRERPSALNASLYHFPCPNVYENGNICPGDTPFPPCAARTIGEALDLFLEGSAFNGDLRRGKCQSYPEDVRGLWDALDGKKAFPLSELVPARVRLQDLC
jgi:hypothetical protein